MRLTRLPLKLAKFHQIALTIIGASASSCLQTWSERAFGMLNSREKHCIVGRIWPINTPEHKSISSTTADSTRKLPDLFAEMNCVQETFIHLSPPGGLVVLDQSDSPTPAMPRHCEWKKEVEATL
jgi:hypothetical protein